TLVPAFPSERYSLGLAPFYLSFTALLPPAAGRLPRRARAPLLALVLGGVFLLSMRARVRLQRQGRQQLPTETGPTGRAPAPLARPGERVMSRKGQIGYYSGLEVEEFPRFATLAELGAFARARRVSYLYYSWYESLMRPEFAYLLDTTSAVPGL